MNSFKLGVEQATKAIHEGLKIAKHEEAAEYVRVHFLEALVADNIDTTLKEVFATSRRELEKNTS
ncbi:MAG: hypothetical protein KAQ99_10255 [Candidatus Aureabacteria bacterium]|nr:hypothetical protein [Candidatus Auribacterota bacterium]